MTEETISGTAKRIEESFIDVMDLLYKDKYTPEVFDAFHAEIDAQFLRLKAAMDCKDWKSIEKCFPGQSEHLLKHAAQAIATKYFPFAEFAGAEKFSSYEEFYADYIERTFVSIEILKGMSSTIPEILKQYRDQTGYSKAITLEQFIANRDPATGKPASSLYSQCATDQQAFDIAYQSALEIIQATITRVSAEKITSLDLPLDKVNESIWGIPLSANDKLKDGFFHFPADKRGSGKKIDIVFNIDFDKEERNLDTKLKGVEIPILTRRARRVMIAANELYKHSDTFSKTQIYHAMGGEGTPNSRILKEIDDDLNLLLSVIHIDNSQEIDAGYRYPHVKYTGAIMPHERVFADINGKIVLDAVHLFRQPVLSAFAEGRKQITTVNIGLMKIPLSKTEKILSLEDYLISRIARMKNSKKQSHKILYETIFLNCRIESRKEKTRSTEQINTILEHFKTEKFIKSFSVTKDKKGINISFDAAPETQEVTK